MASAEDPARSVNIVFVGAGAVGCFYASRLHHPTHNIHVSLIARSNYSVLARSGVKLTTHSFDDYIFVPAVVYPSVSAASVAAQGRVSSASATSVTEQRDQAQQTPPSSGWDYVIVTTKALPDRVDDAATIAPLVTLGRTCIVLIQNGVGVEHPYRSRFPSNPIVSAVTVVSAALVDPGTVRQNRWTRLYLGPYVNAADIVSISVPPCTVRAISGGSAVAMSEDLLARGSACVTSLATWWTRYGLIRDVESYAWDELSLQTVRWHKLVINAAFNPSSILSGGLGNADMVLDSELRRHLKGIMDEIFATAPHVLGGRPFPPELATPEKILASTQRNKGAKPSMLLDWEAGRPLELEVIVGNPIRIARAKGVEMPRLQSVYALLRSMQDARDRAGSQGNERGKGKL